jgi:hypothetical protein
MIDISAFKVFLNETFPAEAVWVDEFKPDLQFVEVDCFYDQPVKLAIEISPESIKLSTISKEPTIDFSLYDYSFNNFAEAASFVLQIKEAGVLPAKSK